MANEMFTPTGFKDLSKSISINSDPTKAAGSKLKEWNEILKTVDSIAARLGFNLKDIMQKNEESKNAGGINVAAKIEQGIAHNTPPQQVSFLKVNSIDAAKDLIEMLKKRAEDDPKMKITDALEFVEGLNKMGTLSPAVAEWINKFVEIAQ